MGGYPLNKQSTETGVSKDHLISGEYLFWSSSTQLPVLMGIISKGRGYVAVGCQLFKGMLDYMEVENGHNPDSVSYLACDEPWQGSMRIHPVTTWYFGRPFER